MILICTDHRYARALVQARRETLGRRGEPTGHAGSPWSDRQLQFAHLAAIRREDGLYDVLKCRHSSVGAPVTLAELRDMAATALALGDGTSGLEPPQARPEPAGRRFDLDDPPPVQEGRFRLGPEAPWIDSPPGPAAPAGQDGENGIPPTEPGSAPGGAHAPAVRSGGSREGDLDARDPRGMRGL